MSRMIDADALTEKYGDWYVEEGPEEGFIGTLGQLLSGQPETSCSEIPNNSDTISRKAAIDTLKELTANGTSKGMVFGEDAVHRIEMLPSAQPFHNITMNDVLKYIDSMPEDVWQEFTCCLECRGWELQWCGGDFA